MFIRKRIYAYRLLAGFYQLNSLAVERKLSDVSILQIERMKVPNHSKVLSVLKHPSSRRANAFRSFLYTIFFLYHSRVLVSKGQMPFVLTHQAWLMNVVSEVRQFRDEALKDVFSHRLRINCTSLDFA